MTKIRIVKPKKKKKVCKKHFSKIFLMGFNKVKSTQGPCPSSTSQWRLAKVYHDGDNRLVSRNLNRER
jgi:hypothetical protein